jgi:CRP/FNR family transcriptional regulator
MMDVKDCSNVQPNLSGRCEASDSINAPICSEAPAAHCLANCIAICSGIQDAGQVGENSGQPPLKFIDCAIDARRTIFYGRDRIEGVPFICDGWAAIVAILPNRRRQIVALLLPGDLVSGALVFDDKLGLSVEAITNVTYRTFDRATFRTELLSNSRLLESILKIWNEQSMRFVQLAASLGQCTAEERVAGLLVNLMERITTLGMVKDDAFHFPLRQSHIAEITGLTSVHVSRVMNLLRQKGLIDLNDRTLTVRDPAALKRISNH